MLKFASDHVNIPCDKLCTDPEKMRKKKRKR